jgi:hypothetical protein
MKTASLVSLQCQAQRLFRSGSQFYQWYRDLNEFDLEIDAAEKRAANFGQSSQV